MKAAVIPARGIGDALLMMIASDALRRAGHAVTTFHPALSELAEWFPSDHRFAPLSQLDALSSFDLVIAQNDNCSPTIKALIAALQQGSIKRLSLFYPTYYSSKNAPLQPDDKVFNASVPMASNVAAAIAELLTIEPSKDNGLRPPSHLTYRKNAGRVLLHPMSSDPEKNWPKKRYLALGKALKRKGYHPVFAVSSDERKQWEREEIDLPHFDTLAALAAAVYESGYCVGNDSLLGHLASNLGIPTLIISNHPTRMRLWRPGWHPGKVLTPPKWIPNLKFYRLREKQWRWFISPWRVLSTFEELFERP